MRTTGVVWAIALAVGTAEAQTDPVAIRPTGRVDSARVAALLDTARRDTSAARTAPRRPTPGCFRAQSLPRCTAFLVTDIGMEFPIYTTRRDVPGPSGGMRDFTPRLVWGVGFMRNVGGNKATGAVASLTSELSQRQVPWMVEWRYRQWRNSSQAIDVGVGYKTNPVWQGGAEFRGRGVTAMVAWTPNRWIGLSGRADLIAANGESHHAALVGIESTRSSELLVQLIAIGIVEGILSRIGFEVGND